MKAGERAPSLVRLLHVRWRGPVLLPRRSGRLARRQGPPAFCTPPEHLMSSKPSRFRRQQPPTRKPRSPRLLLELLEDRLSPAANLLVTTTLAGTEQVLREFTPVGGLVRTALLPPVGGAQEAGRDLVYDQSSGKVHVYTGTFDPALSSYDLALGGWTQRTYSGWSTVNNLSYGGIGLLGDYVYATDMATYSKPGDEAQGVVRFNLADGTSARFL